MYSAQGVGTLKEVILHYPGEELDVLTPSNLKDYLFDGLVYRDEAKREIQKFAGALQKTGITTRYLGELVQGDHFVCDAIKKLPNLLFIRDLAVVTSDGAIISSMRYPARGVEPLVVKQALWKLGIEILCEIKPPGILEGGDVLFLDKNTMLVGRSERTNEEGIEQVIKVWLLKGENRMVAQIPIKPLRTSMHLDSVIGIISQNLVCIHSRSIAGQITVFRKNPPGNIERIKGMTFQEFLDARNIEKIEVTQSEQWNMACNILMIEPGKKFICYERSFRESLAALESRGIKPILLDLPQLFIGAGGPHCLALELRREVA